MSSYYNEHDPKAAAWLRELIKEGHIPPGEVDERDIQDIKPHELTRFTQQHFFAGIGGWALALRLAGWADARPVRTGSCPCQPFSAAGKGLGEKDERHLWPQFRDLITFGEATITFGEQVASAAGRVWLAGIRADLEAMGYAVGAADLCSAGVGSPNIRQRLYWMAHAAGARRRWAKQGPESQARDEARMRLPSENGRPCGLAYANGGLASDGGIQRSGRHGQQPENEAAGRLGDSHGAGSFTGRQAAAANGHGCSAVADGDAGRLEHTASDGREQRRAESSGRCAVGGCGVVGVGDADRTEGARQRRNGGQVVSAHEESNGHHAPSPWARSELLPCTDGKTRRIEPGSFPLAHGIPGRVGLLRGYGNAINPWLAAEFILACEEALN